MFRHLLYPVWCSHGLGGHWVAESVHDPESRIGHCQNGGRIYAQLARVRSMSGRIRSRATSRGRPDISRES